MSETKVSGSQREVDATHEGIHPGDEHHPTPRKYVQIAIVLAVLTALEVSTFYIDFDFLFLPMLIGLMIIKFVLVAGWFMHLRFDTRLYTRLVVTGLTLALSIYAIVLVTFTNVDTGS